MRLSDLLPIDYTEGRSSTWNGQQFRIVSGIPRQMKGLSAEASHTQSTYAYMWRHDRDYGSEAHIAYMRQSLSNEYPGYPELTGRLFGSSRRTFLDLGCGSGYSAWAFLGDSLSQLDYIGVELSASVELARRFLHSKGIDGEFMQADIADLPFGDDVADAIFCTGVIQHTDNVDRTVRSIARLLKPDGLAFLNCYRTAPPLREWSDRHVHEQLKDLPEAEALSKLAPLTKFGMGLGTSSCTIDVPEDVEVLGLKKGSYPLQQFFFDYIFRAYFHNGETFERLQFLNYDWYTPRNQHHVAPDDFVAMCTRAGLALLNVRTTGTFTSVMASKHGLR